MYLLQVLSQPYIEKIEDRALCEHIHAMAQEPYFHEALSEQEIETGKTPLHYALASGRSDVVRALLSHGARSDIQDRQGRRPLDYLPGALNKVEKQLCLRMQRLLDDESHIQAMVEDMCLWTRQMLNATHQPSAVSMALIRSAHSARKERGQHALGGALHARSVEHSPPFVWVESVEREDVDGFERLRVSLIKQTLQHASGRYAGVLVLCSEDLLWGTGVGALRAHLMHAGAYLRGMPSRARAVCLCCPKAYQAVLLKKLEQLRRYVVACDDQQVEEWSDLKHVLRCVYAHIEDAHSFDPSCLIAQMDELDVASYARASVPFESMLGWHEAGDTDAWRVCYAHLRDAIFYKRAWLKDVRIWSEYMAKGQTLLDFFSSDPLKQAAVQLMYTLWMHVDAQHQDEINKMKAMVDDLDALETDLHVLQPSSWRLQYQKKDVYLKLTYLFRQFLDVVDDVACVS